MTKYINRDFLMTDQNGDVEKAHLKFRELYGRYMLDWINGGEVGIYNIKKVIVDTFYRAADFQGDDLKEHPSKGSLMLVGPKKSVENIVEELKNEEFFKLEELERK